MKVSKPLKRICEIFMYGIISSLLAFLLSTILSSKWGITIYDSMTGIGILIIVIGALSFVSGNAAGIGINSMGQLNSQYLSYLNLETTRMERNATKYYESCKNHILFYFKSSSLNIILNGIIVVLAGIIMQKWC